jgi:hypothetical protein
VLRSAGRSNRRERKCCADREHAPKNSACHLDLADRLTQELVPIIAKVDGQRISVLRGRGRWFMTLNLTFSASSEMLYVLRRP